MPAFIFDFDTARAKARSHPFSEDQQVELLSGAWRGLRFDRDSTEVKDVAFAALFSILLQASNEPEPLPGLCAQIDAEFFGNNRSFVAYSARDGMLRVDPSERFLDCCAAVATWKFDDRSVQVLSCHGWPVLSLRSDLGRAATAEATPTIANPQPSSAWPPDGLPSRLLLQPRSVRPPLPETALVELDRQIFDEPPLPEAGAEELLAKVTYDSGWVWFDEPELSADRPFAATADAAVAA